MFRAVFLTGILLATPLQASKICSDWPYENADPALAGLLATLDEVHALVPSLVRAVDAIAPRICLDAGPNEAHGSYAPETSVINIQADLTPDARAAVLLHELRHLDQGWRGICFSPELTMRDYTRAVFALEADAMAVAVLAAWDLSEKGTPGPWQALNSLPESSDIAAAFAAEMAATGDVSMATAAAFDAWYGSDERRERYYVATCESYLSAQERSKRLPMYQTLGQSFLADICRLPDGGTYPCEEPEAALPRP